ncbi:helix-turn-helix domain-containing protein [Nesterenkonia marinintestina]|uniref:helix-turn-helix domain-containing protein n=1 Tax=Nesterenkonia marinintestina TaxID=2979865 RepID=UPI0028FC237B|nr:helix-turn-helix transcriptional regulator [Nesterenkonia sp. GX14115]
MLHLGGAVALMGFTRVTVAGQETQRLSDALNPVGQWQSHSRLPPRPQGCRRLHARLRRERGMSIERLAEAAAMHRRSIIQIEAGRVAARISTLHSIAHAPGVPPVGKTRVR